MPGNVLSSEGRERTTTERESLPSRSLCSNRGDIAEHKAYLRERKSKDKVCVLEKFDNSLLKAKYFIRYREQKDDKDTIPVPSISFFYSLQG